jgi:hypothetical protein
MKYTHWMATSRKGTSTFEDEPTVVNRGWGNVLSSPNLVDTRNRLFAEKGSSSFTVIWDDKLLNVEDPFPGGYAQSWSIYAWSLNVLLGNDVLGKPDFLPGMISDSNSPKMMCYYSHGYGQGHTGYRELHHFISRDIPLTSSVKANKASILADVSKLFIDKIQSIGAVREVLLVEDEDEATIWTVISATPFEDEIRRPVYEAQLEVLQSVDQALVDFRLVNIEEFPSANRGQILPREAKILLKR